MLKSVDLGILILRLAFGGLMLFGHGWSKFMSLFAEGPIQFADVLGMGAVVSLILAVFAEVLCAFFVMIGFQVRLSALVLTGTMFVAGFLIHAKDSFFSSAVFGHGEYAMLLTPSKEMAIIYGCAYLALIFMGAGRFSLDQMLGKRV